MPSMNRRQFLAGLGAAAAGAAFAGTSVAAMEQRADASEGTVVPFYGRHQSGITTAQQDRLCFAAFDATTSDRAELASVLKEWTAAIAAMTRGAAVGAGPVGDQLAPPEDTGEALDLHAARLTVTVGFGPTLFTKDGVDRFGIAHRRPNALIDLPEFNGDQIQPSRSGGDICVQACADDPQVAFHAVRNLARISRGKLVMRWNQLGFGRTATTSREQGTPRNLMGMMDGTNNVRSQDIELLRDHIWVDKGDDQSWMTDGSYVVVRRIRMLIETWDRASLQDQEQTIGRHKLSGAPLGKRHEREDLGLDRVDAAGEPIVPADAHVRLAAPETNGGMHLLRRGYSYTDGMDELGQLDAGLFFIAFQRDPRTHFVPIQQRLARNDALNEYIKHVASGIYAVPPGVQPGGWIGEGLLS